MTDLTPPGTEPHDLELDTDDLDRILEADLVLYLGGGFQPAVERSAARSDGTALDLLPRGEDDPHVWLDPRRMRSMVDDVRDALVALAPTPRASEAMRTNAGAYAEELEALDTEMESGLASCQHPLLVTAHDAFGHLAARFGLENQAIAGLDPGAEPDPRRVSELADLVRARGVTTVFTEELVPADVAETLAREAGVTTAVLDPLEALSDERRAAGDGYVEVMRDNLEAMRTGLGCSGVGGEKGGVPGVGGSS